jgi:hypothetical protein
MRPVFRLFALLLAMLLVAQATGVLAECEATAADMGAHHGMDGGHHPGAPSPSHRHLPCQTASCPVMAGCTQLGLAEPTPAPLPPVDPAVLPPPSATASHLSGLAPPEPPPPRA